MQKTLIIIGIFLILIGIFWPIISKLGIGNLPGDILFESKQFSFYFPLMSCILISVILTLAFWLFNRS